MRALIASFWLAIAVASLPCFGQSGPVEEIVPADLLAEALRAKDQAKPWINAPETLVVIDYRKPSSERRFYLIDLTERRARAELVAHGKGSDTDHDGMAERFSNIHGSKMTSLGAFVTGQTYYGRHGLSLRLHGLDPINDQAEARAIVIHGADYVSPARAVLGRSWGCPALEQEIAQELIPKLAGGVFVYAKGP